jgi:4-diphosphocytidyl-2-C-methyl-D-erythritol kinase
MTPSSSRVRIAVPAKINLHLQVLGRRDDGFHEVRTLLQSIDLLDHIEVEALDGAEADGEALKEGGPAIQLEVSPADAAPSDETNLVIQAARALQEATGCRRGARIRLKKAIPAGAGLGGGSADAAATLVALDRLWGLGLDRLKIHRIAARLGSDVPFFLIGGLALGVGRGEEVYPLPDIPELALLVALPQIHVSTAEVYRRLNKLTWDPIGFSVYGFSAGLRSGMPWSDQRNDLQPIVLEGWPQLGEVLTALERRYPVRAGVTGSGAALFALFASRREAERAVAEITRTEAGNGTRFHIGRTLGRAEATIRER